MIFEQHNCDMFKLRKGTQWAILFFIFALIIPKLFDMTFALIIFLFKIIFDMAYTVQNSIKETKLIFFSLVFVFTDLLFVHFFGHHFWNIHDWDHIDKIISILFFVLAPFCVRRFFPETSYYKLSNTFLDYFDRCEYTPCNKRKWDNSQTGDRSKYCDFHKCEFVDINEGYKISYVDLISFLQTEKREINWEKFTMVMTKTKGQMTKYGGRKYTPIVHAYNIGEYDNFLMIYNSQKKFNNCNGVKKLLNDEYLYSDGEEEYPTLFVPFKADFPLVENDKIKEFIENI